MSFKNIFLLLLLFYILFLRVTQSEIGSGMLESKKYYASFSGYNIPLKLAEEISESEALSKHSYYIGFFLEKKLVRVEKYVNRTLFFQHFYYYNENGALIKSKIIGPDKTEKINTF